MHICIPLAFQQPTGHDILENESETFPTRKPTSSNLEVGGSHYLVYVVLILNCGKQRQGDQG